MSEMTKRMQVFAGTANRELAEGVAQHLGIELGNVKIRRFANGEIYVRFLESVRGADVFLVESLANPVNASLMELLIMADAARRASARNITAVWPSAPPSSVATPASRAGLSSAASAGRSARTPSMTC